MAETTAISQRRKNMDWDLDTGMERRKQDPGCCISLQVLGPHTRSVLPSMAATSYRQLLT